MDSITRIKNFISECFPNWNKLDFSEIDENIDFRRDMSELYRINNEEIVLLSYTNISITGTDRVKPQLRVFLDEYKKPFLFAKKHNLRFYLFSIFTKDDKMARGLDNFNPKEYIISIETNLDIEGSRRDLRSIYDYANEKLNGRKFLKCSRENYKADINQASLIYIGTSENPEKETFENFINMFDSRPYLNSTMESYCRNAIEESNSTIQKIYYGAPGTGKSHEVRKQTGELLPNGEEVDLPNVFRTTFHPDTDYASFVGCYKPTMRKTGKKHQVDGKDVDDEEIIYEYVPQVFADAYVYTYIHKNEQTYLVIEEINRGNCAQIFGDLFQLLDRKNGISEYKIKAEKDLAAHLEKVLGVNAEGIKDRKLCLPANLHILATMNTSDQSLFPMDSAFKRRWDWEYIPIKYSNSDWIIDIAGYKYSWIDFQTEINKRIFGATESEDKQLGDFFVKANDNNIISSKLLLNKVIFYLWNDVCKDGDGDIFKVNTDLDYSKELDPAKNEDITFSKFFKETDLKLKQWMRYLNIKPLNSQEDDDEEKEDEAHQQEEGVKPNEAKPDTYSKPEYKSIIENMLPQLSNEDIKIFGNGFDWSFSEMPGSYARVVLTLDAPAKDKKAAVKLWIPALSGYSRSAECFAFLKDHGGEGIIRTTASKYGYEYEELGIHSKNPNPVVGWKITIPMTFAPENSQAESQNLLDILSEVRTAFNPIISDFLKK